MGIKRKGRKAFLIVIAVFAVIIAGGLLFLLIGLGLKDVPVKDIDISRVPDGVYTGTLTGSRFGNTLEVTVHAGRIADILIRKDMVVAIPEISSKVFSQVRAKQSLQIDSISGATVSAKAYLKSLEMALDGK